MIDVLQLVMITLNDIVVQHIELLHRLYRLKCVLSMI